MASAMHRRRPLASTLPVNQVAIEMPLITTGEGGLLAERQLILGRPLKGHD